MLCGFLVFFVKMGFQTSVIIQTTNWGCVKVANIPVQSRGIGHKRMGIARYYYY